MRRQQAQRAAAAAAAASDRYEYPSLGGPGPGAASSGLAQGDYPSLAGGGGGAGSSGWHPGWQGQRSGALPLPARPAAPYPDPATLRAVAYCAAERLPRAYCSAAALHDDMAYEGLVLVHRRSAAEEQFPTLGGGSAGSAAARGDASWGQQAQQPKGVSISGCGRRNDVPYRTHFLLVVFLQHPNHLSLSHARRCSGCEARRQSAA